MEATLEQLIINHIAKTGFEDLDSESIRSCKKLVLDSLGVVFPGSKAPGCPETVDLLKSWRSEHGVSVLLHGFSTPPPLAAMANSMMMHALDFDDTLDVSALHAFVNVLPAALATAENSGKVSGKDFIAALVVGADVICRISFAIDRPLSWIRTATCGGFGAAATAGKILGLGKEELSNALGIMYSRTSGNAQGLIEGRLVKRMQPGFASSAGVTSAYLAARGITGSRLFLTGPYGFYNLYEQGDYHPERVSEGIGQHFTINDLSLKPYPSCRMTHSTIGAALKLKGQVPTSDQIEHIDISVSSMVAEMVGKAFEIGSNPQVDAQFSLGYTTACAFIRGDVFLDDFETEKIMDPAVQRLAGRVVVSVNKEIPAKDIFQTEIKVTLKDGSVLTHSVQVPPGNPEDPMSDGQCREKFNKCIDYSGLSFTDQARKELIYMIDNLEDLKDIRQLVRAMAG